MLRTLFFLCALPCLAAGAKRAFTIEDNYRVRNIDALSTGPGGKVVFSLRTPDLPKAKNVIHLWIADAGGGEPRQLTYSEKGENSPVFSHDGKSIAFISTRDGEPNVYVLPVSGGEARKVTNVSTGIADPVWSPDDKWIAFSSDVYPECSDD